VPNIASAWESIVANECERGFLQSKDLYIKNHEASMANENQNLQGNRFYVLLRNLRDESINYFNDSVGLKF
jgi:hypothetical protein